MNINDKVKVTLTDYGLEVFRNQYRAMREIHPDIYAKYIERTDRVLEIQLWDLMFHFGSNCYIGCKQVFVDNEIELLNPSSASKPE